MKPTLAHQSLILLLVATLLAGCVENRLSRRLSENLVEVEARQSEIKKSSGAPTGEITWPIAIKTLEGRNLNLARSKQRLKEIEEDRKNFYWEQLGPRLGVVSSLSAALDEITTLSDRNYGIRLLGSVRLPQPLGIYAQRYALELQYLSTKLDHENLKRRLYSNLYSIFLAQEDINQLAAAPPLLTNKGSLDFEGILRSKQMELASNTKKIERQRVSLKLQINNLLDTPGMNYQLDVRSLPEISYAKKIKHLGFDSNFGRLGLKQAAIQLETSNARLEKIKIDRLPSISAGVSLPTLYDSRSSDSPQFEDIRLFGSLSESFDYPSTRANNKRKAKQEAYNLRENLKLQLEREQVKLNRLIERYETLLTTESLLSRQLKHLKGSPPPADSTLLLKHISQIRGLQSELLKTKQFRKRIDLEFWVWDESYWAKN